MKSYLVRFSLSVLMVMVSAICSAKKGITHVRGDLKVVSKEYKMTVTINYDNLMLSEKLSLDELVEVRQPKENWKERCLDRFIAHFNDKTKEKAFFLVKKNSDKTTNYQMIVKVEHMDIKGNVTGTISIFPSKGTQTEIVSFTFVEPGDDDDKYLFEDSMEELGQGLGKLFRNQLSKK